MAQDSDHPFNSDALVQDILVRVHNDSLFQQEESVDISHQDTIADLLFQNNRNSCFSSSTDSSLAFKLHSISDDDFNRLKYMLRAMIWPVDHTIRRHLWINISALNRVSSLSYNMLETYSSQTALTTVSVMHDYNLNCQSSKSKHFPEFVDKTRLCYYHLNEQSGHSFLYGILTTFSVYHPDITYCPILEPLAAVFLHYHNEYEVLYLLHRLFIKNWLFGQTRLQWEAFPIVIKKLVKHHYRSSFNFIEQCDKNSNDFYRDWVWWIFQYLPFSYIIKIMDCFLLEGPKVLFRICLTLIHLFAKEIQQDGSERKLEKFPSFCQRIPISIDRLLHIAFHIYNMRRRYIDRIIERALKIVRKSHHSTVSDDTNQKNAQYPIKNNPSQQSSVIIPEYFLKVPEKSMLDHQQLYTIWNWLPACCSLAQPVLIFTTDEHGFRLQTLLNKIDELEYSILLIKSTNGEVFGGFCAGLWSTRHNRSYFGFGETFLFTLVPKQTKYPWVGRTSSTDNNYENKNKHDMFLFVDNDKLIIGGGNGDGLYIEQTLCEGHTTHCDTFDNTPLCSQTNFSISVLEVISFDSSSS